VPLCYKTDALSSINLIEQICFDAVDRSSLSSANSLFIPAALLMLPYVDKVALTCFMSVAVDFLS